MVEELTTNFQLHTFSNGLSGILYLFEFLRENKFIDIDVSDVQPILDNYIVGKMRLDIQQKNYDFMHGALGVGFHFLKRGDANVTGKKLSFASPFNTTFFICICSACASLMRPFFTSLSAMSLKYPSWFSFS